MISIALVALGGALGAIARFGVAAAARQLFPDSFPWGTFLINVSGCALIGAAAGLTQTPLALTPQQKLLLVTGGLGAYTTFSTYALEAAQLLASGRSGLWLGIAYVAASNALGLAAFVLFLKLAERAA